MSYCSGPLRGKRSHAFLYPLRSLSIASSLFLSSTLHPPLQRKLFGQKQSLSLLSLSPAKLRLSSSLSLSIHRSNLLESISLLSWLRQHRDMVEMTHFHSQPLRPSCYLLFSVTAYWHNLVSCSGTAAMLLVMVWKPHISILSIATILRIIMLIEAICSASFMSAYIVLLQQIVLSYSLALESIWTNLKFLMLNLLSAVF